VISLIASIPLSLKWRIPQIQIGLLHTLTYTSKLTVRGGWEWNFTTKEMISIFPLWTLQLYVATFQQHLHMEYISLSWYAIPELVVPIRVAANKEATESRIPLGKVEVITSKSLRWPPWLGWPLWNISGRNDHGYAPLVETLPGPFLIHDLSPGF
jgi:hypothetical protein